MGSAAILIWLCPGVRNLSDLLAAEQIDRAHMLLPGLFIRSEKVKKKNRNYSERL